MLIMSLLMLLCEKNVPQGTADVSASIFNLAKVILGAGVLSLPSGIAAFSDSSKALLPRQYLVLWE